MEIIFRKMRETDQKTVLEMMSVFYASDAVLSNGSKEIFLSDFENCVNDSPYLESYLFEDETNNEKTVVGYAMIAKSFSTEFGKPCVWIEDLYIKSGFRGKGIGSNFLKYIAEKYPACLLRLEAEAENAAALSVYKRSGFEILPYAELIKNK